MTTPDYQSLLNSVLPRLGKSQKAGAYGRYVKINARMGVKVIVASGDDPFKTAADCEASRNYERAKAEFELLREGRKRTRLVPMPYAVGCFKARRYFFPCIFMEHIPGRRYEFDAYENKKIMALGDKLEKLGIIHGDLHGYNVIFDSKQRHWRPIDFGPNDVEIRPRKRLTKKK